MARPERVAVAAAAVHASVSAVDVQADVAVAAEIDAEN